MSAIIHAYRISRATKESRFAPAALDTIQENGAYALPVRGIVIGRDCSGVTHLLTDDRCIGYVPRVVAYGSPLALVA